MKLVSAEDLSGKERAAFDLIAKHFPPNAVCVNVMLGGEPWDVRPLLLIGGTVFLYRFSRQLPFDFLRHVIAEMEGFSLLPHWNTSVRSIPASDRFLSIRPFVATTLSELLARNDRTVRADPLAVAVKLIEQVLELDRRHLVHGHITPSNVALSSSGPAGLFLLDPRIGTFAGRKDDLSAPELEKLSDPPASVDLYGLGACLRLVLGDNPSPQHREIVDRLVLASPRQRPSLATVASVFLGKAISETSEVDTSSASSRGRIISSTATPEPAPAEVPSQPISSRPIPEARTLPYGSGDSRSTPEGRDWTLAKRIAFGSILLMGASVEILRLRFPRAYNELAFYVPILAAQSNPEFVASLASGDRARLRSVARAAVMDRDPAAVNAILEDVSSGAVRPGFNVSLLRAAYRTPWKEEFVREDMATLVALTVAQVLPEGLSELPALKSLHPALILAVASQLSPGSNSEQMKSVPIDRLTLLGDPEGVAFEKLKAAGVTTVGDPQAIALCQIIAGTATTNAYDALIGSTTEVAPTLERLGVLLPIVMSKPALADQLLAAIRDRGGDLSSVLGWFDIDDLVGWKDVSSAAKLLLLLEQVPSVGLSPSQYADLLKFPLPSVRKKAAAQLNDKGLRQAESPVLLLLASEQNRLTREQTVALASGLLLDPSKRAPFVALWFQMSPPADTTLLILLGRSALDDKDLFNLEAARYLKKHQWSASTEMLKLLAQHPEPLARSLAYAKLDPLVAEQKQILQERVSAEKDASLLKAVTAKLVP